MFTQTSTCMGGLNSGSPAKALRLEEAALREIERDRENERAAMIDAFKQKIKDVLRSCGMRESAVETVHVVVDYATDRSHSDGSGNKSGGKCCSGDYRSSTGKDAAVFNEINAFRKAKSDEVESLERKLEAVLLANVHLTDENHDLKEHVRKMTSSDATARTVQGLLSSSVRSAEKRINETLARFKNVLRNRTELISQVGRALSSLSSLRDAAGELQLWITSTFAPLHDSSCGVLQQLRSRLLRFADAIDSIKLSHKTIVSQCLTGWEKSSLGLLVDPADQSLAGKKHLRDISADLRATEDLLNTLWITFPQPRSQPGYAEGRGPRMFGPVSPNRARGNVSEHFDLEKSQAPTPQLGHGYAGGSSPRRKYQSTTPRSTSPRIPPNSTPVRWSKRRVCLS
ncbi:hypothetical protein DIPPA_17902 [Diplonema papillatum]|nr:hypothetical protein DIPPA_17902 [Diplonema papillatum]